MAADPPADDRARFGRDGEALRDAWRDEWNDADKRIKGKPVEVA